MPDLASVIPGSEALKIRLESLPVYVRGTLHYSPPAPSFLPSITGMSPSALHEGETAAVLVTGKNFVPGVTSVTILKPAGGTEQRVDVRQIFVTADGTKLGVTLKAGVMTDLAEGDTRHLRLRLTTPAGSAERALDILGHDELDFAGNTLPLAQSRTFSRIRVGVGGVLRIAHTEPPLRITAYETSSWAPMRRVRAALSSRSSLAPVHPAPLGTPAARAAQAAPHRVRGRGRRRRARRSRRIQLERRRDTGELRQRPDPPGPRGRVVAVASAASAMAGTVRAEAQLRCRASLPPASCLRSCGAPEEAAEAVAEGKG